MAAKQLSLGDAELDIMLIIWSAEGPVSSSYIQERLKAKRAWALPTLMTSLSRMCEKGAVRCEKTGGHNAYSAVLRENEYKENESRTFLQKFHGNSFMNMVTALYNGKAIGQEDLSDLQAFIDQLKEGKS
jgi:predicted transcriptional regulator